jgi:streptogramin lyase
MMVSPSAETSGYRLHPDVVWIPRPDGSCRLMQMSANVCAMDDLSTALLQLLIDIGPAGAASALTARYGLDEAQAAADVQTFIADLRKQKLVELRNSSGSTFDRLRALAARILIPAALDLVSVAARSLNARARGLLWTSKWSLAQFGWARSVREWEQRYPPPTSDATPQAETLAAIDQVVRATASRSLMNLECKERAFACWALARERGIPAQLVVGVTHDPLHGHVWVESEGTIISDDPEHCLPFEPVARYG